MDSSGSLNGNINSCLLNLYSIYNFNDQRRLVNTIVGKGRGGGLFNSIRRNHLHAQPFKLRRNCKFYCLKKGFIFSFLFFGRMTEHLQISDFVHIFSRFFFSNNFKQDGLKTRGVWDKSLIYTTEKNGPGPLRKLVRTRYFCRVNIPYHVFMKWIRLAFFWFWGHSKTEKKKN